MALSESQSALRDQLLNDGYCLGRDVLSAEMLARLREATERLIAAQTPDEIEHFKYQGSNIRLRWQDPVFSELVTWEPSMRLLAELGYPDVKYWDGYILSKPPHAPPLYWHQDWAFWDEPISGEPLATQLILIYYLTDTRPENGCLRVIPGTHRHRQPFHDLLADAHTDESYKADLGSPLFADYPGAIDVPVRAGDVAITDARVLHSARGNQTDERRTAITTLYLPRWDAMPERLQAAAAGRMEPLPEGLDPRQRELLESWRPRYEGTAEPSPWNRKPGVHLKG